MKRSVQEIVELLVFGLIALLIGTGLLWLAGWIFGLAGVLFKFFAALIWSLLRFIVPVAVGAAIVYALVRLIQQQREKGAAEKARGVTANEPEKTSSIGPSGQATTEANRPGATNTPASTSAPAGAPPADTAEPTSPTPPAAPPTEYPSAGQGEGEAHATASEVWVPPQPSPPAGTPDSNREAENGPTAPERATGETAADSSVPPLDDEPVVEEPREDNWGEGDWGEGDVSAEDDESDDDEHRS